MSQTPIAPAASPVAPAPAAAALAGRRHGKTGIIPAAAAVAIGLVAGFACSGNWSPRAALPGFGEEVWPGYRFRADHLAADIATRYPPDSHEAKLTFRITFPLLMRWCGIDRAGLPWWFLSCAVAGVNLENLALKGEWTQLALWNGGQALWGVPVLMLLAHHSSPLWQVSLAVLLAGGVVGSFLVADVTRSLNYLWPLWLAPWLSRGVAAALAPFDPTGWWRRGLVVLALLEPNFEVVQHLIRLVAPQWHTWL